MIEAKQFESIAKRNSRHEKVYEQSEYTVMISFSMMVVVVVWRLTVAAGFELRNILAELPLLLQ